MTTGRSELVRLHFGGEPYAGGALDAGAFRTVLQFQKIVTEAARAVWKARHPARERVPKGFDERTQLCFAAIEGGSVSIRLVPRSPDPTPLLDAPTVMEEAVRLTSETLGAANRDEPPPRGVPMHVVRVCQGLGRDLPAGARFSFTSPNPSLFYTLRSRRPPRPRFFPSLPLTDRQRSCPIRRGPSSAPSWTSRTRTQWTWKGGCSKPMSTGGSFSSGRMTGDASPSASQSLRKRLSRRRSRKTGGRGSD